MLTIIANRMRTVDETADVYYDWCGLCRRTTDHFAEHDDEVQLGLAAYGDERTAFSTGQWTAHFTYDRDIVRTDLSHTELGNAMHHALRAAQDRHIYTMIEGKVSLVKPVGDVITQMAGLMAEYRATHRLIPAA